MMFNSLVPAVHRAMSCGPVPGLCLALALGPVLASTAEVLPPWKATVIESPDGRVVDARNPARPIGGARITLPEHGIVVTTDADGHFELPHLPEGTWTLEVRAAGYAEAVARIRIDAEGVLPSPLRILLEPAPLELSEVVVTASPLGGGARYQAATALDRAALDRRPASSIAGLLDGEAGIATRSMGPAPSRPVIRGFGGDRILVVENGERMGDISETAADHAIHLDPASVERIEVVRGPAGLLYGSSALGGVVNLITRDLSTEWSPDDEATVTMEGSSVDRGGALHGAIVRGGERWVARSRAGIRGTGELRTPEARLPGTGSRSIDAQVGLAHRGDRLHGALSASVEDRRYGIPEAIDDPAEEIEIRGRRAGIRGILVRPATGDDPAPPGMEIRWGLTHFGQEELEFELGPRGVPTSHDVELAFDQWTVSSTLTLRHRPVGPLGAGALGLSFQGRSLEVGGQEAFTPGLREGALGLFLFQELPLANRLRLQLGVRGETRRSRTLPNADFPTLDLRRQAHTLSGALGLNVRPRDRWEVGVQFARAHRAPTLEERHAEGPHLAAGAYEIGDPSLGDEIGHGFDGFMRYGGGWASLELAGFMTRVTEFVAFRPTGQTDPGSGLPIFRYEATDARLVGGEATLRIRLAPTLTTRLGADLVRGREDDDVKARLPAMPPTRFRVDVHWEDGVWDGSLGVRAARAQHRVAPDEAPTAGYALVEAGLARRLDSEGRHRLTLRLENLTNTLYRDHLSRVEERGYPMPGRNVTLHYRWRM